MRVRALLFYELNFCGGAGVFYSKIFVFMSALFYIGLVIAALSFIPLLMLSSRSIRERRKYARVPLKLEELKADYRRKRLYILVMQLAGILLAIISLML